MSETQRRQPDNVRSNRRPLILTLAVVLLLVAGGAALLLLNSGNQDDSDPAAGETPDPQALLNAVVLRLRDLETFQLLIEQEGAAYPFAVSLDEGQTTVNAVMRRGEAQYIQPENMYANIRLRVANLPPIGVELFAQGQDQWFKLASSRWINWPIADGFDPGSLIQENSGFAAALSQLQEVEYIRFDALPNGERAHHVRGIATGDVINELLFNLLEISDEQAVIADVYILPETDVPTLLIITLPGTANEETGEDDTAWRIEIYDVNGPPDFNQPPGIDLAYSGQSAS